MKDQLRLADYLHHIVEATDRIFLYTEDIDEPGFLSDAKTQTPLFAILKLLAKPHEISNATIRISPRNILTFRGEMRTCWVINLLTDISKSTLKMSGARSALISRQ